MKILLLGHTGKIGTAIRNVFADHRVIGKGRKDFDAEKPWRDGQLEQLVKTVEPEVVVNAVVYMSIDACEVNPGTALWVNTLLPKSLAELSNEHGFTLVHFSSDATFSGRKRGFYTETDANDPINVYGLTKFGGDCFVRDIAERHYVLRLPVLLGPSSKNTQFVEKIVSKALSGEKRLRIADDIVSSPTYSMDVAGRLKIMLKNRWPYGLYHVANEGSASLYELMQEVVRWATIDCTVERASYKDFEHIGKKNTHTPLTSSKTPDMRPWREAVRDWCMTYKVGHMT